MMKQNRLDDVFFGSEDGGIIDFLFWGEGLLNDRKVEEWTFVILELLLRLKIQCLFLLEKKEIVEVLYCYNSEQIQMLIHKSPGC